MDETARDKAARDKAARDKAARDKAVGDEAAGSRGFEERLRAARVKQGLDAPPPRVGAGGSTGAMGIGLRVGVELVSALAVAVVIGWALDRWLGTTPWLLALFVLLGGGAGVANVWRLMMPRKRP